MAKRNDPEYRLHVSVAQFLDVALPPDWIWTSVEMGVRTSKAEAGRLKAKGCRKGWPDIQIFPPWGVMLGAGNVLYSMPIFIELKSRTGTRSQAQKDLHRDLQAIGYDVCEQARSVEAVEAFLRECGVPLRASTKAAAE